MSQRKKDGAWKNLLFPVSLARTSSQEQTMPSANAAAGMEEAIAECRKIKAVTDSALAKPLRLLESFSIDPDYQYRQRWANRLTTLGIVPILVDRWPHFWDQEFATDPGNNPDSLPTRINFVYAMKILWYGTQVSIPMASSFSQFDGVRIVLGNLRNENIFNVDMFQRNPFISYLTTGLLNIILNVLAVVPKARNDLAQVGAVQVLQGFTRVEDLAVRQAGLISLSFLIRDDENHLIASDDSNIKFLVNQIQQNLGGEQASQQQQIERQYQAQIILKALFHLAVNDRNKVRIVRCGVVPVLNQILKDLRDSRNQLEELILENATALLWHLAFVEDNKEKIRKRKSIASSLEKLKASDNPKISQASVGILYLLSEKSAAEKLVSRALSLDRGNGSPKKRKSSRIKAFDAEDKKPKRGHAMISYSPVQRALASLLKQQLEHAGMLTWMDIDKINGPSLDAVTEAIDEASVVFICFSEEYKKSPHCRMEAELAVELRQMVLPLRVQDKYEPDGWLGAILGEHSYFDSRSEEEFQQSFPKILREIRSKLGDNFLPSAVQHSPKGAASRHNGVSQKQSISRPANSAFSEASSNATTSPTKVNSAIFWSEKEVKKWLAGLRISSDGNDRFKGFKGHDLMALRKMYLKAPNAFYKTLNEQMNFELLDMVRFSEALESLK